MDPTSGQTNLREETALIPAKPLRVFVFRSCLVRARLLRDVKFERAKLILDGFLLSFVQVCMLGVFGMDDELYLGEETLRTPMVSPNLIRAKKGNGSVQYSKFGTAHLSDSKA